MMATTTSTPPGTTNNIDGNTKTKERYKNKNNNEKVVPNDTFSRSKQEEQENDDINHVRIMFLFIIILICLVCAFVISLNELLFVIQDDDITINDNNNHNYHTNNKWDDHHQKSSANQQYDYVTTIEQRQQHKEIKQNKRSERKVSDFPILEPSSIYTIPNSMNHIGDKSDEYARLRKEYDTIYPPNTPIRSFQALQQIKQNQRNQVSMVVQEEEVQQQQQRKEIEEEHSCTTTATSETENTNSNNNDDSVLDYDKYNCPIEPPIGYPYEFNTVNILQHWPPNQIHPIPNDYNKYNSLCIFNALVDSKKIINYRSKFVPFIIRNDPQVAETVERWNTPGYLIKLLDNNNNHEDMMTIDNNHHNNNDDVTTTTTTTTTSKSKKKKNKIKKYRVEYSKNNKFLYWAPGISFDTESQPTQLIRMTYSKWLERANGTISTTASTTIDESSSSSSSSSRIDEQQQQQQHESRRKPDQPHWYFRLIGCGENSPTGNCEDDDDIPSTEHLFDELPFFQPRRENNETSNMDDNTDDLMMKEESSSSSSLDDDYKYYYLVDPADQNGIHCRFGMPGVVAINHFDNGRNSIVVLGGLRRYILTHPKHCSNLSLYPRLHPSARHTSIDWTQIDNTTFLEELQEKEQQDSSSSYWKNLSMVGSTEVVLEAGDVLYLPSYWFHFIVSLTLNYQCNTRSGKEIEYLQSIKQCGF